MKMRLRFRDQIGFGFTLRAGGVFSMMFALLYIVLSTSVPAQSGKAAVPAANSLVIRLEQKKGEHTSAVRPEHVFDPGDVIRFRLTSGTTGYLYVINQGSSGHYSPLFPAPGTQGDNHLEPAKDYFVPSTENGWFEIEGPAGFDVVYFLVSPIPIDISAGKGKENAAPMVPPASLKPRCNDAIFQARGECIDSSAGPAPLARDTPLPPQIRAAAPNASRDIVFTSGDEENSVSAASATATPVVYTFRLAHR